MFLDRAEIIVEAGRGGNGARSFRREKYVPLGGPDGGDGGRGGNVILVGHGGMNTLHDLTGRPYYRAGHGGHGAGAKRTGKDGADVLLAVPPGTVAADAESGDVIGEVLAEGQRLVVAKGGAGGKGNVHFVTPTNRAPERTTRGRPGQRLRLRLELKVIAQVGLVGLPNAGKSTLISALTAARAKVAEYPFTTVQPVLGTMTLSDASTITLADIPGLIAGAHAGAGMGFDFLRHVERTELLVYLLDASGSEGADAPAAWGVLREEIARYDAEILSRPCLVVLNKMDLLDAAGRERVRQTFLAASGVPAASCFLISARERLGLEALREAIEATYRQLMAARVAVQDCDHE